MTRIAKALLLVGFLTLVVACGGGEEAPRAERADSAGVAIVTNTGQDRPLVWSFEPELTLGGVEFYEVANWTVGSDAMGNIYVLDRDGKRVLRYDPTGALRDTLGGPGQGPGEMEWPNILVVTPDGKVSVGDFGRGRVITWAADGSLLGEDAEADPGSLFRAMAAGEAREVDEWSEEATTNRLVHIGAAGDTTELASVVTTGGPVTLESCGISFSGMPAIFSPRLRWDAADGRIAVAAGPEFDVRVSDDGDPTLRIRRKLEPRPATTELALAELGEGMRIGTPGGERVCDPDEVIDQRGLAEYVPLIEQVVVEPGGRVWAQRFVAGDDPGAIDVFESDGEYLGTLPAGTPLPIGFLPDGRAMTSQTDELDVERLVIGRFVETIDS